MKPSGDSAPQSVAPRVRPVRRWVRLVVGDWAEPDNWEPRGVPTSDDHVVIPDGCQVRVGTGEAHFASISKTGSVILISESGEVLE